MGLNTRSTIVGIFFLSASTEAASISDRGQGTKLRLTTEKKGEKKTPKPTITKILLVGIKKMGQNMEIEKGPLSLQISEPPFLTRASQIPTAWLPTSYNLYLLRQRNSFQANLAPNIGTKL